MFFVYMVASRKNGTLYTGHREDLENRIQGHKEKTFGGFTAKYGVDKLVWFETHPTREEAFRRERQIKEWKRLWKLQLIENRNPQWADLFPHIGRLLQQEERRELSQSPAWVPAFAGMSGSKGRVVG